MDSKTLLPNDLVEVISQTVLAVMNHAGADVTLKQAEFLAKQAQKRANQIGVPMSIAVVDSSTNLVLHQRMEKALLVSVNAALNKAYTAASFGMSSGKLLDITQSEMVLTALQNGDGRIMPLSGGLPIVVNEQIIGAIGVSGGQANQDEEVALYALQAFSQTPCEG
ncbi:GlcG/HbpS family heme-binding protein [Neisseria sp. Ec49-e6-T10]|uniref:GlcG/HbpS family heme-binding protein n=1 Tax=Neisseria sp. Ec49-e6-T10 TaxID=3140744 RepID=UPI003EBE42EF